MAKYEKYAEYKDSGIEWLGDIPSHWSAIQLKRLGKFVTGMTPSTAIQSYYADEETEYGWIRPEDIFENSEKVEASKFLTKLGWETQRPIPDKSTVVCCIGTIGKLGFLNKTSVTNQQITALIPTNIDYAKYYYYFLCASRNQLEQLSTGNVVKILNSERLGSLWVPLLSNNDEASKIANFLDHETAKIDTLIAKQEKLIELLKEKRQAVISHAVTKGLNPDVAMKDSGVEWLGQVPEHWELYKLKHACSEIFLGLTSKVDYVEADGVPLVRALNIKNGVLDLSTARQISIEQHEKLTKYRCAKRNDILLSKSGTIGTAAIVDTDIEFSIYESIFALRGRAEILLPTYLLYFIQSKVAQAQYEKNSVGMGVVHLNMPDIEEVLIPLPPKNEQVQILEHLVKSLEYFKSLIYKAESAIQLMQERRTALISSAVTGKIDVRNWQHPKEAKTELSL